MPGCTCKRLKELIHPLNDVLGFYLGIIEGYARKLPPADKFEIMNACKELKRVRIGILETITGMIESATSANAELENAGRLETRLALLQGKDEAFVSISEFIEQQRHAIQVQVK